MSNYREAMNGTSHQTSKTRRPHNREKFTLLEDRRMINFIASQLREGNPIAKKKGPAIWKIYERTKKTTKKAANLETHFRRILLPNFVDYCDDATCDDIFLLHKKLKIPISSHLLRAFEKRLNCKIKINSMGYLQKSTSSENDDIQSVQSNNKFFDETSGILEEHALISDSINDHDRATNEQGTSESFAKQRPNLASLSTGSDKTHQKDYKKNATVSRATVSRRKVNNSNKREKYTRLEERIMLKFIASELRAGNEYAKIKGPTVWKDYVKTYETKKNPIGLESHFRKYMLPQLLSYCNEVLYTDFFLLLRIFKIRLTSSELQQLECKLNCSIQRDEDDYFYGAILQKDKDQRLHPSVEEVNKILSESCSDDSDDIVMYSAPSSRDSSVTRSSVADSSVNRRSTCLVNKNALAVEKDAEIERNMKSKNDMDSVPSSRASSVIHSSVTHSSVADSAVNRRSTRLVNKNALAVEKDAEIERNMKSKNDMNSEPSSRASSVIHSSVTHSSVADSSVDRHSTRLVNENALAVKKNVELERDVEPGHNMNSEPSSRASSVIHSSVTHSSVADSSVDRRSTRLVNEYALAVEKDVELERDVRPGHNMDSEPSSRASSVIHSSIAHSSVADLSVERRSTSLVNENALALENDAELERVVKSECDDLLIPPTSDQRSLVVNVEKVKSTNDRSTEPVTTHRRDSTKQEDLAFLAVSANVVIDVPLLTTSTLIRSEMSKIYGSCFPQIVVKEEEDFLIPESQLDERNPVVNAESLESINNGRTEPVTTHRCDSLEQNDLASLVVSNNVVVDVPPLATSTPIQSKKFKQNGSYFSQIVEEQGPSDEMFFPHSPVAVNMEHEDIQQNLDFNNFITHLLTPDSPPEQHSIQQMIMPLAQLSSKLHDMKQCAKDKAAFRKRAISLFSNNTLFCLNPDAVNKQLEDIFLNLDTLVQGNSIEDFIDGLKWLVHMKYMNNLETDTACSSP